MLEDWNFWFSIITAGVALIALFQSKQQIKLSNKQHLFDMRLETYLIASGLIQLFRGNDIDFNYKEDRAFTVDSEFRWLLNNTYLEQVARVIDEPFENPGHKDFLVKLEELKDLSTKINFLFYGKESLLLQEFILGYKDLLFALYQYQILLNNMKKHSAEYNKSFEECQEYFGENQQRTKLQEVATKLEHTDGRLKEEKVEEKIKKQIKFV